MIETMYLLRTPANRERLARSRADVAAGNLYKFKLMAKRILIRKIVFTATAQQDLAFWEKTSLRILQKINAFIASILEDPRNGIGKPEKLKSELSGAWSRRINYRDRIVYEVENDTLIILQIQDHY